MRVDLSHLNEFVRQEQYQSSILVQALADIAATKAKFFTVLDAIKGATNIP